MPWFPEFANASELARRATRSAGRADPVTQYLAALHDGDAHGLLDARHSPGARPPRRPGTQPPAATSLRRPEREVAG